MKKGSEKSKKRVSGFPFPVGFMLIFNEKGQLSVIFPTNPIL
jgi:hypothetical protein